jgi:hypothetical protein
MIGSRRAIFLAALVWSACPAFGQVVLIPKNADGVQMLLSTLFSCC